MSSEQEKQSSSGAGVRTNAASAATGPKRKEIYNYEIPSNAIAYSMAWSRRPGGHNFKLAVSTYREEYINHIHIIKKDGMGAGGDGSSSSNSKADDGSNGGSNFTKVIEFDHPYPPTKIMWAPKAITDRDLLATTGDYLRLWTISEENKVDMKTALTSNKLTEYCSPLTSFDWNDTEPSLIGTCSIDTSCAIWDINKLTPVAQLIAHDKEVYDIAFACGKDVFGTVGADGSLRMFDLRSLEHSTILYESPDLSPLLKIEWNKLDPNYIATIQTDSYKAIILDIRIPSMPMAELIGHQAAVNSIAWAPYSPSHICTCSDDRQAFIWDITVRPKPIEDPVLAFTASGEINNVHWCASHEDWVCITHDNALQVLRV